MTHEEKKTFLDNVVKLIIGIILLTSCFFYLHQNSAEKIAIYSGFRTIAQKVEVFFYKIIGKNGQLLEQRYKLEEKFSELISVAEEKWCLDTDILNSLHTSYNNLLNEDKGNMENYMATYGIIASEFENRIVPEDCNDHSQTETE